MLGMTPDDPIHALAPAAVALSGHSRIGNACYNGHQENHTADPSHSSTPIREHVVSCSRLLAVRSTTNTHLGGTQPDPVHHPMHASTLHRRTGAAVPPVSTAQRGLHDAFSQDGYSSDWASSQYYSQQQQQQPAAPAGWDAAGQVSGGWGGGLGAVYLEEWSRQLFMPSCW